MGCREPAHIGVEATGRIQFRLDLIEPRQIGLGHEAGGAGAEVFVGKLDRKSVV